MAEESPTPPHLMLNRLRDQIAEQVELWESGDHHLMYDTELTISLSLAYIALAVSTIEKQFGKGSFMRLGDAAAARDHADAAGAPPVCLHSYALVLHVPTVLFEY